MVDKTYKDAVESQIVNTIAKGVEEGKLKEEELPIISQFVLQKIDGIQTQDQMIGFLSQLSLKWPVFQPIALQAEGKVKQIYEKQVASSMMQLISEGKTTQAIDLAKSLNTK